MEKEPSFPITNFSWLLVSQVRVNFNRRRMKLKVFSNHVPGCLTAICTNPIWVIKTRMLSTSSEHPRAYSSVLDGGRHILRTEGLRGFYRGLVPSLFGVSHGAMQFMVYEKLKSFKRRKIQRDLTSSDFLILSGLAKVFAGVVTYPYQVVRARLQMYDSGTIYRGAKDVIIKILRQEGIKGFYKGLTPNLLRVLPSTWVTFLAYEKTRLFLQNT
jgi:solute carrier family 25 folate transporter 32